MRLKITNVITNIENFFFWQDSTSGSSANTNVHFMLKTLEHLCSHYPNGFPRKLFLVMDSASNNKNFTMALCIAILVRYGLFDEAQIMFLPVGHTHWMNDQLFSVISKHFSLSTSAVKNPYELHEYLSKCVHSKHMQRMESIVEHIIDIPDYTAWFHAFGAKNTKTNIQSWGINRWQFFKVVNPDSADVEIRLVQYKTQFTFSEIMNMYWRANCHGAFGFEVMRRFYEREPYSALEVHNLQRDFTHYMSQPSNNIIFQWFPLHLFVDKYMSTHHASTHLEHFKRPNMERLNEDLRYVNPGLYLALCLSITLILCFPDGLASAIMNRTIKSLLNGTIEVITGVPRVSNSNRQKRQLRAVDAWLHTLNLWTI
jgi:hypothetical protein